MKKATVLTSAIATRILTDSFKTNPSALWVIKKDGKIDYRLQALVEYAVKTGVQNDGVFLSDDKTAAAICMQEPIKEGLKSYWNQFQLVKKAIGFSRIFKVLAREAYLKKHRPDIPHLNFWFLGVDPKKKRTGSVFDLKEGIFSLSKRKNLPILIETSVERNKLVYERFGFECYHIWKESEEYTLWFMRRNP